MCCHARHGVLVGRLESLPCLLVACAGLWIWVNNNNSNTIQYNTIKIIMLSG